MIRAIFEWLTAPRRHKAGMEDAMRGLHEAQKRAAVKLRHRFGAGTPGSPQNPHYKPRDKEDVK